MSNIISYYSMNDPFPWNDCTSLVIYAGRSMDDNPNKSFLRLVFNNHDSKSGFIADKAPYLTVLDAEDLLNELKMWKTKSIDSKDKKKALETEEWVKEQISKGWTYFLYELEPRKYAGDAYLWARKADGKRK